MWILKSPITQSDKQLSCFTDSARQNAYLVALAALIKSVPKSTYAQEMPAVSMLCQPWQPFYRL